MAEEGPITISGVSINNCLVNASCVALNDSIYVFGGFHLFTDEVFDDLYILQHNVWRKVEYMKGLRPCKRCDHSATSWGQERIVIFGGLDSNDVFLNDLHILNLSTMTWTQPPMSGPIPTGRGKHSAIIEDGKLYVYGGWCASDSISNHLNILDLETFVWQAPVAVKPRHSHFSFLFRDALFVYGGISESLEPAAELLVLPLGTSTERMPNQTSFEQQGASNNQTELFIHSFQSPGTLGQRFAQICGNVLVLLIVPSLCYRQSTLDPENALVRPSCGLWTLDLADCARLTWTQHAPDMLPDTLASGEWHYFTMAKHCPSLYVLGINPGVSGAIREPLHFGHNVQDGAAIPGASVSNVSPTNGLLSNDDAYLAAVLKLDLEFSTRGVVYAPVERRLVHDMGQLFDAVNPSDVGSNMEQTARNAEMKPVSHDVEIQSQSGDATSVFAHRLVLLTRWSHYAAIERSGMYEKRSGGVVVVTLPERYETVRQLVKYFYTNALDKNLTVGTLSTLLVLSNMYNLASLKRLAASGLYSRLDASNAALIYVSALKSLSTSLTQTALKHMMTHFGAVVRSDGFRDLLKDEPEALDALWKSVPLQSRVVAHVPELRQKDGRLRRDAQLALRRTSEDDADPVS
ncbi:hypothetical protein HDU81_007037 [Chytriomyces hyalinus]|nr:hypothetical protein HDU81_007037 [Chytriomyces hyalinus]